MAVFSVSGITSGIDFNELIDKLIEVERQPIKRFEAERKLYDEKVNIYGQLSEKLSTFAGAVDALKDASSFYLKIATSGDESVFSASASAAAAPGTYLIDVTKIAQAHKIASDAVVSDADPVSSSSGDFSFQVGTGEVVTVEVTDTTTLVDLKNAINAAGSDVQATIVNTGGANPYRLILTARDTGAENTITITENVTNLGFPTGPKSGGLTLQAAQDAEFTVDTLAVTKSSNVVSDVIEGVTLTLAGQGAGALTVVDDVEGISSMVEEFVSAYNDVVSFISGKSQYDSATQVGGPFATESTTRNLLSRLSRILASSVDGLPDSMKSLAQMGFSTNRDGTLTLNDATFSEKLSSNLRDVANVFFDPAGGVARRIDDYLDDITDTVSGSLSIRKKGIERLIKETNDSISDLEVRLIIKEERLREQFSNLEVLLGTLKAQSSFLSGL